MSGITRCRCLCLALFLCLAGTSVHASSIVTFETGKQPTAVLHVATTGNNTTGNGSAGNPFATTSTFSEASITGWSN